MGVPPKSSMPGHSRSTSRCWAARRVSMASWPKRSQKWKNPSKTMAIPWKTLFKSIFLAVSIMFPTENPPKMVGIVLLQTQMLQVASSKCPVLKVVEPDVQLVKLAGPFLGRRKLKGTLPTCVTCATSVHFPSLGRSEHDWTVVSTPPNDIIQS